MPWLRRDTSLRQIVKRDCRAFHLEGLDIAGAGPTGDVPFGPTAGFLSDEILLVDMRSDGIGVCGLFPRSPLASNPLNA